VLISELHVPTIAEPAPRDAERSFLLTLSLLGILFARKACAVHAGLFSPINRPNLL
jgi:hypothetical protein